MKLRLLFNAPLAIALGLLLEPTPVNAGGEKVIGVPVTYQLPTDGPLPRTYLVTLAITDAKNPDWIVSQFACGVARTVTAENHGQFSETWGGLDDNFMPVPPGDYGVKGICAPAQRWQVDNEFHAITPRFVCGASAWLPSPEEWQKPEPFGGDPVGSPLRDVAVGPNGVAVFHYQYLENGLNCPMIDLKKPVGPDQFIRAFNSGGAAGGLSVTTDGETVWAFCAEGGPKYVYRTDGKSFGNSEGANRSNGYLPEGWVTAMANWHDSSADRTLVFVAQRGKIVEQAKRRFVESDTEFVDQITVHDGANGKVLATLPLARPLGLAVQNGRLYALHAEGATLAVSALALPLPEKPEWKRVFTVPPNIHAFDLEADSHGRFYLSDTAANKVFQLDAKGKVLRAYGHRDEQQPGSYDPETFMSPAKLATWTDAVGKDRLIVVENGGPNRASEWSDDGKLLREFLTLQTKANDGYAIDPDHPDQIYVPGHEGWLTRFKVDYAKRTWTVDAVWPEVGTEPRTPSIRKPIFIRAQGRSYLACASGSREGGYNVFRLDEKTNRWLISAAILRVPSNDPRKPPGCALWHDANGNGRIDDNEITPSDAPAGIFSLAHGQNWGDDLSFLAMPLSGREVWRIAPESFDAHGNPVFKEWKELFTDPVLEARANGTVDAAHGGNETAEKFTSDWMQTDGTLEGGYYVQARGGKNFSANEGSQHKISRYVPDGHGGYALKWRTGRTALEWTARAGEMYGGMRIHRPINGLLSVIDQSRCGILLYTDDGLYVDTLFTDGRRFTRNTAGLYAQGGEFFAGTVFNNHDNGKIYFALGKHTPLLYEAEGWSLKDNPVHPLTPLQKTVTLTAAQTASPPEIALSLRGGAGKTQLARFSPALGDVALDGSMNGWESAEPVTFASDKDHTVETRLLYKPDALLLRWHARLGAKFEPRPLPPVERLFTHDQLADTLSFYVQTDPLAKPGGNNAGRTGDVRFVFGLFKSSDGTVKPIAMGMYPDWHGKGKANPQTYRTPVGEAKFAHVGEVSGMQLAHQIDADGLGFVIVAAIPRNALPQMKDAFGSDWRTLANFSATFSGHNKFWWANRDGSANRETFDEPSEARLYPGSWAPVEFAGLSEGVVVRQWLVCGPFGGLGTENFKADPNGVLPGTNKEMKKAVRDFCEAAHYPPDDGKVDLAASFTGEIIQGYWRDPKRIGWKLASIEPLDTRILCGSGGQTWYGVTWIHTPAAMELSAELQSHPMTELRWTVNDQPMLVKQTEYQRGKSEKDRVAAHALALRAGWNKVMFRGYCIGYPLFRAGLVLKGQEEKLWTLQLSASPPRNESP